MNTNDMSFVGVGRNEAGSRPNAGGPRPRGAKLARIEVNEERVVAAPLIPEVSQALCYRRHTYEVGGPRGVTSRSTGLRVYRADDQGRFTFQVGLVAKVRATFERHGYEVEVNDVTERRERVVVDEAAANRLCREEVRFAKTLACHRRGLIVAPRFHQRVAQIAAAAHAFPEARITVACLSRTVARRYGERLQPLLEEPVSVLNEGGYVICDARVQVTTWGGLNEAGSDIVFFATATDGFTGRFKDSLGRYGNAHVHGFAIPGQRLGARERLLLEGMFGGVVFEAESHGHRSADVHVLLADAPDVAFPRRATDLERKRLYWHSDRRNGTIAAIARAFADGRPYDLLRHGIFLDAEPCKGTASGQTQRVAVLVESPEHARALVDQLPGWRVLDARHDPHATQVPNDWMRPGAKHESERQEGAIVTLARANQIDNFDIDVLIRGDGNSWPLDLPCFPPCVRRGARCHVVLVDLGDEGDETAINATRRRLDDYQARGWVVEAPARWRRRPEFDEMTIAVGR